jgi:hypothetical protein
LDNPWTEEIEQCHDSLCEDVEILCVSYEVYIDSVIYNEQGTMVTVVPATNGGTAPFVYDWSTLDLPMIDQQGGASFEFGNDFVTAGMIGVTDANGCTGFTTDFYFDAPVISCELTAESQVSDSLLVVSFELFYNGIPVSEPLVIFNSGDGATLSSFPMNAYQNYFSYVYNNPGSYTWCLNTAEGQQGVCQVEVCSPIDIEDISGMVSIDDGDPFLVFPNPCKGFVSMEVQASDGIEIYDQQGKLVYQMGVVATGYLQLNLALSSGLYTIRCSRNHSVLQARLLVE